LTDRLGPLSKEELKILDEGLEELIGEAEDTIQVHEQDPILNYEATTYEEAVEGVDNFLETLSIAKARLTILQRIRAMVKAALGKAP
jgi:hypothetical protein